MTHDFEEIIELVEAQTRSILVSTGHTFLSRQLAENYQIQQQNIDYLDIKAIDET
jgi:hypothetical protein